MNEEKYLRIKGRVEYKSTILDNPEDYRSKTMLCLAIEDIYLDALKMFGDKVDLTNLEITLKEWPKNVTDRAVKFFFTLRDRVCEASEDQTREHKDHIYRMCLKECKFLLTGDGIGYKTSITQLDKRELWHATEKMFNWCFDAEAYVGDLQTEFYSVREGLNI